MLFDGGNRLLDRDVCATEGNFLQTYNSMHAPFRQPKVWITVMNLVAKMYV